MPILDRSTKERFLADDPYNALRWLFEGAIAWKAALERPERAGRHQSVFGMYMSLVEARALYEFFYKEGKAGRDDDARACHFGWKPPREVPLYSEYMKREKPANKRVFHLVYNRSAHAGGTGPDELNKRVLEFAKDLRRLTEEFARKAEPDFCDGIQRALQKALQETELAANHYGIPNPL
jgi:hypothetical protein